MLMAKGSEREADPSAEIDCESDDEELIDNLFFKQVNQ
jgi:hypothetical protein